ncbi:MAG TPA: lysophospholipid acyltransferase family protein [Planctomycetota bacterium]|nr:lysophospholipid acyltransferase family protein [Planctomycetota bacterium]
MSTVSYAWRVLATCFAFCLFNVGGLLAAASAIAACRLLPGTRERKAQRAQRVIQCMFASFIACLVGLGLLTHSRKELQRLRSVPASLVIANHPTLLDVVFLIASMPKVDCVVKEAVWNNVFMRATVRGAGYIPNRDGVGLVNGCVERLALGHHVLMFPEGTRSPAGGLRRFQRGAARVALRSRCEILPILIRCEPPTLLKGMPIFRVPPRRPHFSLTIQEPISPVSFLEAGLETPLATRRLTAKLEQLYEESLGCRCV